MDTITTDFENWGLYLMKQFQQMYDKGERCDLEISCNQQIFLVHRLILSACSEYVRELGDKQHIILPDEISCKAIKSIIDFVYTGKIVFSKDEKDDLLLASNLLNMRLLTELIKLEESCSFTLSMDDESEETKSNENTNNNMNLDLDESADLIPDEKFPQQPLAPQVVKRKEARSARPRGSRNTVLPPLFKFPYLQQKFSSSRTYGLITILTDMVPSRFDIPESVLQNCPFQSSFEDVTYETNILCSYETMSSTLQPVHHQFLKKMKESPQKRSFANALFSPFDKYTPPYNMKAEPHTSKKREPTTSYLSTRETPAYKKPTLKTPTTRKKSVTFAKELEVIVECPSRYAESNGLPATPLTNSATTVENHTAQVYESSTAAIDITTNDTSCDIDMELPAPLSPVMNISDDIIHGSLVESGEKVELTRLKNVAVPMEIEEETCHSSGVVDEYLPELSVVAVKTLGSSHLNEFESTTIKLANCENVTTADVSEIEWVSKNTSLVAAEDESMQCEYSAIDNEIEATTSEFPVLGKEITVEAKSSKQNFRNTSSEEVPGVNAAETTPKALHSPTTVEPTAEIAVPLSGVNNSKNTQRKSLIADEVISICKELTLSNQNTRGEVSSVTSKAESTQRNTCTIDTIVNTSQEIPFLNTNSIETVAVNSPVRESVSQNLSSVKDIYVISQDKISTNMVGAIPENILSVASKTGQDEPNNILLATQVAERIDEASAGSSNKPANEIVTASNISITSEIIMRNPAESDAPSASSTNCSSSQPELEAVENSKDINVLDSNVITAIDKKSVPQISTEANSQIFALKVKGTENPTQLSQLVDLCKKNPLFKNKNVKFKIVPVKGSISKTLHEHVQLSSNMLNKAIIVQRTANSKSDSPPSKSKSVVTVTAASAAETGATEIVSSTVNKKQGRISSIENVTGPWECNTCCREENSLPLKFSSYFEYRTHLNSVHNEPNNPVYCLLCGYKSLKRNLQLYHLLTKHKIEPPSNFQFPQCERCGFYALNEYFLQKHLVTHQAAGLEYVCSCKLAFKTSELLQQHMASNDCKNSNNFSCGYCNTLFNRFVNLKAHMRVCMKQRAKFENIKPPLEDDNETILP